MDEQKCKQRNGKKPTAKLNSCHVYGLLLLLLIMTVSVFLFAIPFHIKMAFLGFAVAMALFVSMTYYIFNK